MPSTDWCPRSAGLARPHDKQPGYSRWLIPPAALAIHFCIGQAYATSVYKAQLQDQFGAGHTSIGMVFSIAIVVLGLSAALFGTWVDRVGPRKTMFTAACCWAAGFLIAAAGVAIGGTFGLWVVYFGYGVIGGIGLGLGYISPVSTLIKWFPDRPGLATGMAIGILENAGPMIKDFFRELGPDGIWQSTLAADPATVAVVAGGFVALLSVGNMAGRFLWSTCSDYLGRKNNYILYLGGGAVLFVLVATLGSTSTTVFVLCCMVIVSFYGAGFSTVPSYLRDLFGTYQVGAIHGRLLTAWSTAGILGPLIINRVLDSRTPVQGPDPENPGGTVDVLTASDYNLGLYIMVGVLLVGFVCNLLITPVSERFHEKEAVVDAVDAVH